MKRTKTSEHGTLFEINHMNDKVKDSVESYAKEQFYIQKNKLLSRKNYFSPRFKARRIIILMMSSPMSILFLL